MKTLKDLPKETNLSRVKVKTPKGVIGFIKSLWQKGVWLSDGKTNQIYPQFVDKTEDILSWELDPEGEANCDTLQEMEHIDNSTKPYIERFLSHDGTNSHFAEPA